MLEQPQRYPDKLDKKRPVENPGDAAAEIEKFIESGVHAVGLAPFTIGELMDAMDQTDDLSPIRPQLLELGMKILCEQGRFAFDEETRKYRWKQAV